MIEGLEIALVYSLTDGAIAVNNLDSVRQRSWSRFWQDPLRPGIAESIVEQEHLTLAVSQRLGCSRPRWFADQPT